MTRLAIKQTMFRSDPNKHKKGKKQEESEKKKRA